MSNHTADHLQIEQDQIIEAGALGNSFFEKILGMSFDDVLVTDSSELSDFSFSGEGFCTLANPQESLRDAYNRWDAWVLAKIKDEYGLELNSTKISLLALFALVEASESSSRYLH